MKGLIMKKTLTILLALGISTSAFGINVKVINNTNINGGWNVSIGNSKKNLPNKNTTTTFKDVSSNFSVKAISNVEKYQNEFIQIYKYTTSDENMTIHIEECNNQKNECQQIILSQKNTNTGAKGQQNIYYYFN